MSIVYSGMWVYFGELENTFYRGFTVYCRLSFLHEILPKQFVWFAYICYKYIHTWHHINAPSLQIYPYLAWCSTLPVYSRQNVQILSFLILPVVIYITNLITPSLQICICWKCLLLALVGRTRWWWKSYGQKINRRRSIRVFTWGLVYEWRGYTALFGYDWSNDTRLKVSNQQNRIFSGVNMPKIGR